ncbi:unnamed protein product [Ectocarpus sp. 8 AP-2014]
MVDKAHVAAERRTVVVGTAPPLEDVLSRVCTERPFDLDSFLAYAKKNFFAENLAFLEEVSGSRWCSLRTPCHSGSMRTVQSSSTPISGINPSTMCVVLLQMVLATLYSQASINKH